MTTSCGNCGKNYRVPDHLAGKRLRCKQCKSVIEIPPAESVVEEPAIDPPLAFADENHEQFAAAAVTPPSLGQFAPAPIKLPRRGRGGPVDDGQSLQAFRSRLRDERNALVAFANATAQRYSRSALTAGCCNCHREEECGVYEFHWKAVRRSRGLHWGSLLSIWVGAVVMSTRTQTVAFATYHRLCGRCVSGSSAMSAVEILGKVFCGIFLGIGVLLSAVGAAMQSGAHGISMLLVVGLIMTIGSLIGLALVQRVAIPIALRRVGPRPFVRQSMRRCA